MINLVIAIDRGNLNPVIESFSKDAQTYVFTDNIPEKTVARILQEVLQCERRSPISLMLAVSRYGETRFFRMEDVYYIESFGNLKSIKGSKGTFEFYGVLYRIERIIERLGFIRVHHSYIISLNQVRSAKARSVVMQDGLVINIGRTYLERYREAIKCRGGCCQAGTHIFS